MKQNLKKCFLFPKKKNVFRIGLCSHRQVRFLKKIWSEKHHNKIYFFTYMMALQNFNYYYVYHLDVYCRGAKQYEVWLSQQKGSQARDGQPGSKLGIISATSKNM